MRRLIRCCRRRDLAALAVVVIVTAIGWPLLDVWLAFTDAPDPDDPYLAQRLALGVDAQREGEDGWPLLASVLERLGTAGDLARYGDAAPQGDGGADAELAAVDAELDAPGVMDDLRAALAMPRHVRPWTTEGFPINELLPLVRPARLLGRALAQRAAAAAERGAWGEAVDLVGLALRLGEVSGLQATSVYFMVGSSILRDALRAVREIFAEHAVPPESAAALAALVMSIEDPALDRQIEIARLETRSIVHWTHGSRGYALPLTTLFDADVVSGGIVAMTPVDPQQDGRSIIRAVIARWFLAPREECDVMGDRYYAALQAHAAMPFATRWDAWPPADLWAEIDDPRYALLAYFLPALQRMVDEADALLVERDATRLMALIEQHGAPPASLDELVPEWIDALPADPIHGGPYGYRVLHDDAEGRAFILYSYGADGVDDGGRAEGDGDAGVSYRVEEGADVPLSW